MKLNVCSNILRISAPAEFPEFSDNAQATVFSFYVVNTTAICSQCKVGTQESTKYEHEENALARARVNGWQRMLRDEVGKTTLALVSSCLLRPFVSACYSSYVMYQAQAALSQSTSFFFFPFIFGAVPSRWYRWLISNKIHSLGHKTRRPALARQLPSIAAESTISAQQR